MGPTKMQGAGKMMLCPVICGDRIIRQFFVGTLLINLNAYKFLIMLQEEIFSSLLYQDGNFPAYFQQDGAPSHFGIHVCHWLDKQFPGAWIGGRGPVEWPPGSADPTPLDFYLWEHLKVMVYLVKIQNINNLKQRITNAITSINPERLEYVLQQWRTPSEMCFQHNDSHVEYIMH